MANGGKGGNFTYSLISASHNFPLFHHLMILGTFWYFLVLFSTFGQKMKYWGFPNKNGGKGGNFTYSLISVSHNFPLFHHLMKTYRKQILIVPLVVQLVLILYIALYLVIRCDIDRGVLGFSSFACLLVLGLH